MATLRGEGFSQTKTKYEQQLKTWGFSKNLQSGEWKAIGHKVEKRKRENKDSDVVASGIRYPPAKVRKETSRHFYDTQEKLQHEAMSPEIHSAVTVCTPAPIDMSFPWPSSLPWLQLIQFAPIFRPGQLSTFPGLAICTQEAPYHNSREGVPQETTIEQDELLPLVTRMQEFSNLDSTSYNVSTMAAELGKLMPESFEGEHFLTSHLILKERGIISASTLLRILAYRFSNNLIKTVDIGVLDFLQRSGVMDPEILTKDLVLAQPTIGAFFEKVFEQAIKTRQIDIVMKALDLGKNPSVVLRDPSLTCELLAQNAEIVASTLISEIRQRAPLPLTGHLSDVLFGMLKCGNPQKVLKILLRHGLDPNLELHGSSLLYYVICVPRYRTFGTVFVEMLLLAGAKVHMEPAPTHVQQCPSMLTQLIENEAAFSPKEFTKLVQLFVSKGCPIRRYCCERHGDALQVAAATGAVELLKPLDIFGPPPLPVPKEDKLRLGPPLDLDILLKAIKLGNEGIVRLCLASGVDINGEDELGRFPLALAATGDFTMLVEELLLLGVNVDERAIVDDCIDSSVIVHNREQELTALEVAVERGIADAVALLLEFGATITEGVLRLAVNVGHLPIVQMLVKQGASTVEDVLSLAVKLGNHSMAQMLVEQGAPISDTVFETALETFYTVPTAPSISRYLAMITGSTDIQLGNSRHTLVIKQAAIDMNQTLLAAVQSKDHLLISDLVGTELSSPIYPSGHAYSILRKATLEGDDWTVDLFLQAYPTAYDSRSLLNAVVRYIRAPLREKRLVIAKKLLDRKQPGTHTDRLEATAINMAVSLADKRDHHALLDLMLHLLTVERGNLQIIRLLLDAGAAVNAPPSQRSGATAFQLAAITGYIGIARLLISLGANINAPGAKYGGRTALEGAAEHGRLDLVQLLLEEGALIEGTGRKQFIRAVGYASKQDHQVLANLLKSRGGWSEIDEHALAREDLNDPRWPPYTVMDEDDCESCDEPAGDFESDEEE
ncbi:hypothetical protein DL771_002953 [Monosporascus sp. 5C6A]|nr:hypothetical protein DL771_002953 [Monosporascus sp. 5C6A]